MHKYKTALMLGLIFVAACLIAIAINVWHATATTPQKAKVAAWPTYQGPAQIEPSTYDFTSMLDEKPYRPRRQNNLLTEKRENKSNLKNNSFFPKRGSHSPLNKKTDPQNAPRVADKTNTAAKTEAIASQAPNTASAVRAAAPSSTQAETFARQTPAGSYPRTATAAVPQTAGGKPTAPAAALAKDKKNSAAEKILNAYFPLSKKQKEHTKKTAALLEHLSQAIDEAVAVPSTAKTKRQQNIEKYLKNRAAARTPAAPGARQSIAQNTPSPIDTEKAVQAIEQAAPGLVQQMEKSYGKRAGRRARSIMSNYAKDMRAALSSAGTDEQKQAAAQAVNDKYQQEIADLDIQEARDQMSQGLKEYKDIYLEKLGKEFTPQTAEQAMPHFDKYIQAVLDASFKAGASQDETLAALSDAEAALQDDLLTVVKKENPSVKDPETALQKINEDISRTLLKKAEEASTAIFQGTITHATQADLDTMRKNINQSNQTYLTEILSSEAFSSLTPQQRQAWEKEAQAQLNNLTEELIVAAKTAPTQEEYQLQATRLYEKANRALSAIEVPPSPQQQQAQRQQEEYFASVEAAYGTPTANQLRQWVGQVQNGEMTEDEFEQKQAQLFAQQDQERAAKSKQELAKQRRENEQNIMALPQVAQLPPEHKKIFRQKIKKAFDNMESKIADLSTQTDLTHEEMQTRQRQIEEETNKEINQALNMVISLIPQDK